MKYMVNIYRHVRQTQQVEIEIADDSRLQSAAQQLADMASTMPDYADGWEGDEIVDQGVDAIWPGYV